MADWMKMNPSAIVRVVLSGNRELAGMYIGEAMNFLHILKNNMNLGGIEALAVNHRLADGTTIRVSSTYGQDQVVIDSPEPVTKIAPTGEVEEIKCSILLKNLPTIIQPMRYPKEVHSGELAGTDFIKTFYTHDVTQCPECKDINWTFKFEYLKPAESRVHHNIFTGLDEPKNHLVYSLSPPGYGEIIKSGHDASGIGGWIIWKAYTETGEWSRTGLGVLLLTAEIRDAQGGILCSKRKKIDVDCCHKNESIRNVEIWWEDFGTCQPFIIYHGGSLCLMPVSMPLSGSAGLIEYAILGEMYGGPGGALYAIPDVKGGCIPFKWTLTGPGILYSLPGDEYKTMAYYKTVEGMGCHDEVMIKLEDRCGKVYTVDAYPICTAPDYKQPQIQYVTLLMACNQSQDLYALYGSAPYTWSVISGGGTIVPYDINGVGAKYTSPASNANCTQNPTIQLTDCCGNTASISLAVNCYTPGGIALGYVQWLACSGCWCEDRGCDQGGAYCSDWINNEYDCDGNLYSHCETRPCGTGVAPCNGQTSGWHQIACSDFWCTYWGGSCYPTNCWTNQCGCITTENCPCDTVIDARTPTMKAGGCCPLNPITGLPYTG